MKIKRRTIYLLAVIFFILLIAFIISRKSENKAEQDIFDINLREHRNLALHIHPVLEIEILGEGHIIPASIGISNQGMKVIHTHDDTGKLHVESPYPHQFVLKDFFTIWEKRLNSTCIFEYCEDSEHKLRFFVNGAENNLKENIPLNDGDIIKISYN